MKEREIREQIEMATKLVETWPSWKQNILVHSAQSTVASPRTPVNNRTEKVDELKKSS